MLRMLVVNINLKIYKWFFSVFLETKITLSAKSLVNINSFFCTPKEKVKTYAGKSIRAYFVEAENIAHAFG